VVIGGPGEVRTLDLMTASQHRLGYLVDFAARLATHEHAKAPQEHSSGTDLVLVSPYPRARRLAAWCVEDAAQLMAHGLAGIPTTRNT
jgi:hypothetical protein